ncbi:MAG: MIP/aquaporin family protein [Gemmatimonadota bacterium]
MRDSWRPCLAEMIGTFGLIFIGAGSIVMDVHTGGGVGLLGIAFAHGIVLAVMVSATMGISGGHINPAVTIGAWVGRAIGTRLAILYILSQLVGAVLGAALLAAIYPSTAVQAASLGTPLLAEGVGVGQGILIEAVLTFFLVFVVYGTAVDRRAPKLGGMAIGLVLVFDILAGGPLTGASMNPARTFGPALVGGIWTHHVVYWAGPVLGGLVAGLVYSRALMRETPA